MAVVNLGLTESQIEFNVLKVTNFMLFKLLRMMANEP